MHWKIPLLTIYLLLSNMLSVNKIDYLFPVLKEMNMNVSMEYELMLIHVKLCKKADNDPTRHGT